MRSNSKGSFNHILYSCQEGDVTNAGKGVLSLITEKWLELMYGNPNAIYPQILKDFQDEIVKDTVAKGN